MCRVSVTIAPPDIFFGPSTATPADFQTLPTKVAKQPDTFKAQPKLRARASGLQFIPSADGITFTDEDFVREVKIKVAQLRRAALGFDASSNNALLARKVLKYRHV